MRLYGEVAEASGKQKEVSDHYGEGPPVPIPNTEVKLAGAEDTWLEAARENRSLLTQGNRKLFPKAKDVKLVKITARVHPYPFRTRKLSSPVPKILGWKRPGKIGHCQRIASFLLFCSVYQVENAWGRKTAEDGMLNRRKADNDWLQCQVQARATTILQQDVGGTNDTLSFS